MPLVVDWTFVLKSQSQPVPTPQRLSPDSIGKVNDLGPATRAVTIPDRPGLFSLQAYLSLHEQDESAWTHELDLR